MLFLMFVCAWVFYFFWGWIGFILGFPAGFFLTGIVHAFAGKRYWNDCIAVYQSLLANNYTEEEALMKISQSAHPELSNNTHAKIVDKFHDINLLVMFFTGALPPHNNNRDERTLEMLNCTSIQHFGGDRYKVVTKWKSDK